MRWTMVVVAMVALTGCVSEPSDEDSFNAASVSPGSGSTDGGAQLTIRGTGFEPGMTVTIGGLPAVVTAVTPTELTVVTPAHSPGAKNIVVRAPDGGMDLLNGAYTYIAPTDGMTDTGSAAPEPEPACRVWVEEIKSARFAQGAATPLAHWRVHIATAPNVSLIDAVITATVRQINSDGTEKPEAEVITETESTNYEGVALFAYRPTSGFGDYRLTVTGIQHVPDGEACTYDAASNVMDTKDQNLFI